LTPVLKDKLPLNFSRVVLFGFYLLCKFSPWFEREKYHNSLAPNLNADGTDS